MGKIRKLDDIIANRIAAGEVIEKLANVVKELVENSIDAKSDKIDIELLESGLKSIKVIDNGEGMDLDDALLAFSRHATSKLKVEKDLFSIKSLGFRGEALPSIASVANVELITSTGDIANKVIYEFGKLLEQTVTSFNKGTMVTVTKLFYITPARFKYLKSPQYELAVIVGLVNKFALSYPNISFRLKNNDKLLFVSSGNNQVPDLIGNIYGIEIAKALVEFSKENRDYKVYGYTTKPIVNRSSSNYINIIVNQRVVNDQSIQRVLKECYEQLIPIGRYPITVIYIEVDPSLIDVNIHPRKQEIKFSEKKALLDLIREAILEVIKPQKIYQEPDIEHVQTKMVFHENKETFKYQEELPLNDSQVEKERPVFVEEKPELRTESKRVIPDMEYIGQYTGTYLIFQNEKGMYLLDQHAAAERIRYERYIKSMSLKNREIQDMLIPLELNLANEILTQAREYLEDIKAIGLDIEIFDNKVLIKALPNWFPPNYELIYTEAVIMNFVEGYKPSQKGLLDDLAKLLACKHSLKANHFITQAEANDLVDDLRKCERPYTCPHGRPIIVSLSNNLIERWFNRVI